MPCCRELPRDRGDVNNANTSCDQSGHRLCVAGRCPAGPLFGPRSWNSPKWIDDQQYGNQCLGPNDGNYDRWRRCRGVSRFGEWSNNLPSTTTLAASPIAVFEVGESNAGGVQGSDGPLGVAGSGLGVLLLRPTDLLRGPLPQHLGRDRPSAPTRGPPPPSRSAPDTPSGPDFSPRSARCTRARNK